MTPEQNTTARREFLHGPPLSDLNRRKIVAICKKHMPPGHVEMFVSGLESVIDYMRGRHKAEQWQKDKGINQRRAKSDKRKLKALSKAISEIEGTQAMQELSGEFRKRFLGFGLFAYDQHGNRAGVATGESVLHKLKQIAEELEKNERDGGRPLELKNDFFDVLTADWETLSGKPPPITENASFDKIAQIAWGEITGDRIVPSFSKKIKLYRKTGS